MRRGRLQSEAGYGMAVTLARKTSIIVMSTRPSATTGEHRRGQLPPAIDAVRQVAHGQAR